MDQVRAALAWLKRYHFWVLTVLVVFIALGCWWSASNKMSAKYASGLSTITAAFSQIDQVHKASFHANDTINNHQIEEIKKLSDSVAKLWQTLYDKQRENVLKWPPELNKSFHEAVDKMQFNEEIPSELRNHYQNYIERHFPELPKQISARPLEASEMGGPGGGEFGRGRTYSPEPMPGANGVPEDNDYICEWLDQGVIRDELNFPQRPSSLRIWITQEDLWVYHTLLDVIAKTNQAAGATRMSNAAVKVVYSLDVGSRAAQYSRKPGRLAVPPASATAAGPESGPPGAPMGRPGAGPEGGPPGGGVPGGPGGMERLSGSGMAGGQMTPDQEKAFLLSSRYLDDKGQPIPFGGGGGDAGATPPATPPDAGGGAAPSVDMNQFGTGFRRLPVRMALEMDARRLPEMLTICANEPLRIEVQEVRINPADIGGEGMGPGMGRSGGFGPGGGGGMANLFPEHTGIQSFPAQPHVKNIVIQGIIYIFNKPNLNILAPPAEQTAAVGG
jgi:hypothetical protein